MDDTSMSSRASSRIFDSDNIISFDQINAYYESEYDNYRPGVVASDGFDTEPLSDVDFDGIDGINLQNIRTMSESITRNFGQPRNETDVDSDAKQYRGKEMNAVQDLVGRGSKSISNGTKRINKDQLGADAPPEPSHIAWVAEELVSPPSHQFMAILPPHLDYVVEIGLGKADDDSNNTNIPNHLHIWEQPAFNEKLTPADHRSNAVSPAVIQEIGIQSEGLGVAYCRGEVLREMEDSEHNHIPTKDVVGGWRQNADQYSTTTASTKKASSNSNLERTPTINQRNREVHFHIDIYLV
ncbi:hypothetical protein E2C01_032028 [Portunus trituberculatus]|uniref:Uncharacterized protein n=1 Tax=Portunus trituberculatus TaxID=210409 RepID=A0A5B7EV00_PORTR|nr:hypothetical protein [Portunus trituberculatus]